jgi:hypothetical protein
LSEDFSIHEMLEVLLGIEGKRKMRLRRKTKAELFQLYGRLACPATPQPTGDYEQADRNPKSVSDLAEE